MARGWRRHTCDTDDVWGENYKKKETILAKLDKVYMKNGGGKGVLFPGDRHEEEPK